MKTNLLSLIQRATLLALLLKFTSTSPAQEPAAAKAVGAGNDSVGIVDFEGAPVRLVLDYYARLTKRSIIAAPNLNAVINFRSQTELSREEAIQALDSVLAINGISVLPMGEKFLKVVQITGARQEGVRVGVGDGTALPASDQFVARVLPIRYAELGEVAAAIQPLLHAYGQIVQLAQSNSLLIIDTGNNVNQMLELLKHVDQPYELRMEKKVYQLHHAKAADISQRVQAMLQAAQQLKPKAGSAPSAPGAPAAPTPPPAAGTSSVETKLILTPDERTNKILVLSRGKDFAFLDEIIAALDVKVDPDIITRIVELNYATADEAAALINAVITGGSVSSGTGSSRRSTRGNTGRSTSGSALASTSPISPTIRTSTTTGGSLEAAGFLQYPEGVRVLPDPRTNTLLLMGTKDDMERLVMLVKGIDSNVPQVLIEVIIGEVTLSNETDTGIDIINRVIKAGAASLYGGTQTGDPKGPLPLNIGATPIGLTPTGAALSSALTYWATFRNIKLDAVIRLLASTGRMKVLSTPVIQTLHNQEGSIIVGSAVPVATSTLSSLVGSGGISSNQLTSGLSANIEYKDVAIELLVTPRVNPDGFVTLDIKQKVNDLGADKSIGGITVPVINKREAQSVVMVKDQNTVVLGGLIKDSKGISETKVPVLGDIPLLGWLFKSRKNTTQRDELIVFIRPVVLRNEAQTTAEAQRRLQMLDAIKELGIEKKINPAATTNAPPLLPSTNQPRRSSLGDADTGRGIKPSNVTLRPRTTE